MYPPSTHPYTRLEKEVLSVVHLQNAWKNKKDRFLDRRPTHPGAILREDVLPALKISKTGLAALIDMPRSSFSRLLDEKISVTAPTAVKLGKFFNNDPRFWMNLQIAHDLWKAEKAFKKIIKRYNP